LLEKNDCCETVRMDSGWLRVARGGSGADAPPLAARPNQSAGLLAQKGINARTTF